MLHRKTQLAAAVGAALLMVGGAAQAQLNVQVYGQVSRALLIADDNQQSKVFHVDNEASGTRFGITGGAPIGGTGLRAGFRIELDLQSNESQLVNFSPTGPVTSFSGTAPGAGFNERHMDAWVEGGWGRFSLGQGDGAANGASESDLSGTGMANGIGVADLGGGFQYRTSTGGFSGVTIGASINQQDFESRYDRAMYTTPSFGGLRGQFSHGQNANADIVEAAAFYGAKLPIGQIAAALGWSRQDGPGTGTTRPDETFGGSISWLHQSGFNLTASYTEREVPTSTLLDATFMYFKGGYKWGQHAIAVDYAIGEDFVAPGLEATMIGVGYVYAPTAWAEFYVGAKQHELDVSGVDEIMIVTIGTRLRF